MTSFDAVASSPDYLMKVNNLTVGLNMPAALKSIGEGKEEQPHGLPPYRARRAFLVDEYPACPKDWIRSTGRIKSYFVPILEDSGLWLDFNACLHGTPNHVAIVISAQGINAITGLPCKDAQLEMYRDECPKHKKAFGPDRLCADCGFKWPKQNYLATTGQPQGQLWLDGFRAEDGFIRQYVFTKQKMRGVANAIIGEDRVFALGISYFLSKEQRPAPVQTRGRSMCGDKSIGSYGLMSSYTGDSDVPIGCASAGFTSMDMSNINTLSDTTLSSDNAMKYTRSMDDAKGGPIGASGPKGAKGQPGGVNYSAGPPKKRMMADGQALSRPGWSYDVGYGEKKLASPGVSTREVDNSSSPPVQVYMANTVQVQQLEIAAGAKIAQRIGDDPNSLDFWQKEPDGLIVINYCTEEDAEKIIKEGKIDLTGHPEGFMAKIPVGNK